MPSVAGLVDAGELVRDALQAFLPVDRIDVSDWAARHRWVEGGRSGLWDSSVAPYLDEPMQTLSSELHNCTTLVGPGQCGKTAIAENWLLASIDADQAPFLWYMQTDEAVRAYVKKTINPLIEAHPAVRDKQGLRPVDDSIGFKRFRGMTAQFLAATQSNLISKTAQRIVGDEWDAYDRSFGDPKVQLDVRRQTYGADSHLLAISHADLARGSDPEQWTAGIMALYRDSDRRTWWWPCPHCNGWSSPNPTASRVTRLVWPVDAPLDEIEQAAALECPCCGASIADGQRRAMNREGRWIALGQQIDIDGEVTGTPVRSPTAGFWIVGAMSPFLLSGIGGLARNRVQAERAYEAARDEDALRSLKEVVVKQWGFTFDTPRASRDVDAEAIAERAEPDLVRGVVPAAARFVVLTVDVQATRFEVLARAWGMNGESWIVDHWKRNADTATSPTDWDELFVELLGRKWPIQGRADLVLRPFAVGIDSGGAAGVTTQAYAAWLRARKANLARRRGLIDGREAWDVLLLKGASGPNAQSILVSYPDSVRKDRFASARGQVPVGFFNANLFKDNLAHQLARADSGPNAVHIPAAFRSGEPRDAFFHQLTAETRRADGRWSNPRSARNEALDLMVMNDVMARLHGAHRINWDAPPAWAAPWDQNSLVEAVATGVSTEAATSATASPARPPIARSRAIVSRLAN